MAVMFYLHASACDDIEECYSWGLRFVDLEYAPMSPGIDAKVGCGDEVAYFLLLSRDSVPN
jgi:hypothetical protein